MPRTGSRPSPPAVPEPPLPALLPAGGVLIFKPLRLPAKGGGRCPGGLGAEVTRAAEAERGAPRPGAPWGPPHPGAILLQVASSPALMPSYPDFSPAAASLCFPIFLMKRLFSPHPAEMLLSFRRRRPTWVSPLPFHLPDDLFSVQDGETFPFQYEAARKMGNPG